jgi:hypothetical protein
MLTPDPRGPAKAAGQRARAEALRTEAAALSA